MRNRKLKPLNGYLQNRNCQVNPQSALERCQLLLQGAFSAAAERVKKGPLHEAAGL
jgi:hypothetical protein